MAARSPEAWLSQAPDGRNFALAIAAGLILELGALAILLPVLSHPAPPAQVQAPIKLTIQAPAAPKPPPPAPKPPPPKPVPVQPVVPPPPLPKPPPPRPVPARPVTPRPAVHHIVHHVPPPPVPVPQPPVAQPPQPQTPPPPPAPAPPSTGQVDLFRDAVRRAVQAAANQVYPQAAQMAHESGSAEITITYFNGTATSVTLTQSSGYPLLDEAAVRAGQVAAYPPPPPSFANRVFPWAVTVVFQLAAPNVDGD